MILSFKIENFRSIKEPIELDFTKTKRLNENHLPFNTFDMNGLSLLNSLILYGRNASGKSNVLKAFAALIYLVENSGEFKHGNQIPPYEPFKLDKQTNNKPIKLDIVFIAHESKIRFNYSIEYSEYKIEKESLYFYPHGVQAKLFERINGNVNYGEYYKGAKKPIEDNILDNQLFLSKASTNKIAYLNEVYVFFTKYFYVPNVHNLLYDKAVIGYYSELILKNEKLKSNILKLIKAADTNITDLDISINDPDNYKLPYNIPEEMQKDLEDLLKYAIKTNHLMFNDKKLIGDVKFDLIDESSGTQKLLSIGSVILNALRKGGVIVIDEFDNGLHPLLSKMLIKLFHSRTNNPNNAQLIFATHDSTLLDNNLFRRDQICFVEKEYEGGSIFYKLSDLKSIRKDIPIDKYYLSGRFKATPVTSEVNLEF